MLAACALRMCIIVHYIQQPGKAEREEIMSLNFNQVSQNKLNAGKFLLVEEEPVKYKNRWRNTRRP